MAMPNFVNEGFEDMLEEDDSGMPMHGIRILTYLDEEGSSWMKVMTAGEPHLNDMVAMLERAKFLMQLRDLQLEHDHRDTYVEGPDGDDE